MEPIIFTIIILLIIYLNMSLPNPYQPVTEVFNTLSQNLADYSLFEQDIEKLAHNLTQIMYKQNKKELMEYLHANVRLREKTTNKIEDVFTDICRITLQQSNIGSREITLICNQIIGSSAHIVEEEDMAVMFYWRVFLHMVLVRNRFASTQGAFLSDHLLTARETCFWNKKDKRCHPSKEEYLQLYKEDLYLTFEERRKKAIQSQEKKVKEYLRIYKALEENKLALKIRDETLNLKDDSILPEVKVLLEKFKKISVDLLSRKINLVISQLRNFKSKRSSTEKTKYPQTIAMITDGTYLDLSSAFKRCVKKYYYCPCSKVNEGNVAFKCQSAANDEDKKNVTLYSHKCNVLYYRSLSTSVNQTINFNTTYKNGEYPTLDGEVFPYMLGDAINYNMDEKETNFENDD